MQLLYSSDITVKPEHWNPKKEEIKAKILMDPAVKRQEGMSSFFDDFDYFLETRKLSDVRTRNFRVIYRAL